MSSRYLAAAAAAAALIVLPTGAASADPIYLPWVSLLPPLAQPVDPSSSNPCRNGSSQCVDRTIREMLRAYADTAASCDHNAIFQLAYLYVTEDYKRTVDADSA